MSLSVNTVISRASTSTEDSDARYSPRPPTYTSSLTDSPTYTSSPQNTRGQWGREDPWTETSPSSTASPTSWEMLDTASTSPIDISSSSATSLDATMSPSPVGPERYIYYRLYTQDRSIQSLHPLYRNDLYLGCVLATSVAPPQTAADIKRCLCKVEKIINSSACSLFIATSDEMPVDDDARVAILAFAGPGSMPDSPLALVIKLPEAEVAPRRMIGLRAIMNPETPLEPRYLYYRLYVEDGEVRCKSARAKPYVGRINVDHVVPPHTDASLKRYITIVEGTDSFRESCLYVELCSLSPMDAGPISILTEDCPGCTPEKPMALKLVSSMSGEIPATMPIHTPVDRPAGPSDFTVIIKGKQDCNDSSLKRTFLDFKKDEVLYTDGQTHSELYPGAGGGRTGRKVPVFRAVNAAGSRGFVRKDIVSKIV